ncbi:hypothetical protein C8Q70DRAFT_1051443 [Cubamyces menziesii]|uniref:Uncharacterized protein n=1 Tax=Trametes cubensis TaxID=1111947 RepID=A0AAD7TFR6_9APHY|nr:hypothetical protein C8Q70DRAFT_1051443 [Cubamyces menziesii]KAJ8455514.1 hypothetical protein ONZ51_g12427 [Trametes cubensis]
MHAPSAIILAVALFSVLVHANPFIPSPRPPTGLAATFPLSELRLDTAARARIPPSSGIASSSLRSKIPRQTASDALIAFCAQINCQGCTEFVVQRITIPNECTVVGEFFSVALIDPENTTLPFKLSVG